MTALIAAAPQSWIIRHWRDLGATSSALGAVASKEYGIPGGMMQNFSGGLVFNDLHQQLGAENGGLAYPIEGETRPPSRAYCGSGSSSGVSTGTKTGVPARSRARSMTGTSPTAPKAARWAGPPAGNTPFRTGGATTSRAGP